MHWLRRARRSRPARKQQAAARRLFARGGIKGRPVRRDGFEQFLPNGEIKASCRQHRAGLMVNEIDNKDEFYDAASADRERAMAGVLYSE